VKSMIAIAEEKIEDADDVREVILKAFGQPAEANIVDRLRANCPKTKMLSLVARDGEAVVGHILFSPAAIKGQAGTVVGMGLAPLAVLPERQRQGIGSLLVRRGLKMLKERGCPFVIVLGHPDYYPRFGFEPASAHGIASQWDGVPDEAFMILIMDVAVMKSAAGVARYRDEFDEAM
jgi:putative acetyltransferase